MYKKYGISVGSEFRDAYSFKLAGLNATGWNQLLKTLRPVQLAFSFWSRLLTKHNSTLLAHFHRARLGLTKFDSLQHQIDIQKIEFNTHLTFTFSNTLC